MSLQQIQPALTLVQGWVKPLDLREVRNRTTAKTVAVAFIAFMSFHYLKRTYDWVWEFFNSDQVSYDWIYSELLEGIKRPFSVHCQRRTRIGRSELDQNKLKKIHNRKFGEKDGLLLVECKNEIGSPRVICINCSEKKYTFMCLDLQKKVVDPDEGDD